MNPLLTVRSATASELPGVHELISCNVQDWDDISMETIEIYYKLDPAGFKVAVLSENGDAKIVGVFVACNIDNKHGFGDLFVVSKEYRGLGIGSLLLRQAVDHFGPRNWAVDAERAGVKHFSKLGCVSGAKAQCYQGMPMMTKDNRTFKTKCVDNNSNFKALDAISLNQERLHMNHLNELEVHDDVFASSTYKENNKTNSFYHGKKRSKSLADFTNLQNMCRSHRRISMTHEHWEKCRCNSSDCQSLYKIVPEKEVMFNDIVNYDSRIHCTPRSNHLRLWFRYTGSQTCVCIDSNNRIVGYACARPINENEFEIGPLFAERTHIAKKLMVNLIKCFPGCRLFVQIPLNNKSAIEMVDSLGLKQDGSPYTRMYSQKEIPVPYKNVFVMHKFGFA